MNKICDYSDSISTEIFPKLIDNLYGCPIRIMASNSPPFVRVEGVTFSLIDTFIVQQFARGINATAEFTHFNLTQTGEPEEVLNKSSDLTIAGYLLQLHRTKIYSFTFPYDHSYFIIAMRNQKIPKTSLEIIVKAFQTGIWVALAFSLIVGSLALSAFENESITNEVFVIFSIIIGTGHHRIENVDKNLRKIVVFILILGLIIPSLYHASVFELMKNGLFKPLPTTLEEMAETRYTDTFLFDVKISSLLLNALPEFQRVAHLFKLERVSLMSAGILQSNTTVAGAGSSRYFYYEIGNQTDLYYVLPKRFFTNYFTIYLTKNSFLLAKFDQTIHRMLRTGLLFPYLKIAEKGRLNQDENGAVALTLTQMAAAFQIWAIFITISIAVFFVEFSSRYIND